MPTLTTSQKVAIAVTVPLVAVVLYVFLKWARDNEIEDDQEGEEFATSSDLVLEVKVPRQHVGTIIGRGGSNIKQIQKESQTRINLKDDEEESEGSEEEGIQKGTRTILVRGSREKVKHAEVLIRKVIAEQPTIEHSTMEIPQRVIGRVIGKGGTTIRQLCRISGAKIKIEEDGESTISAYRTCTIAGTETQIESAKQLLHEKIGEDKMFWKKQRNLAKDQSTFVQLPTDGDYFGVYVSAMENPGHFWIQKVTKDSKKLDELVEEMTVFYGEKDGGHRLIPPRIGDLCCSPFQHDQSWYRGEIIDIVPGEEVQIQYLDFGDTGKVDLSNVKELRKEFCELPFQAIECYLSNIKPKDDKWSNDACNLFEKLSCCARWKVLMARIVRYDNGVPCIELVDTTEKQDINIEKELVKQGYAENNETTPDLKDINIEKELVKQGYAENNETTPDLKNPSTSCPDAQEPSTVEKPITVQETNEQFQSLNFDDEYSELDDNPTFEFASPGTNTAGDELRNPTDVAPASKKTPAIEPTLSAAEHTVVSCVDMSNLPNVLDWDMYGEGIAGKSGKVDPASDARISPSSAANLQGTPDEMTSDDPGILFPGDGSLEVQEHMTDDTASDVPISSSFADDLQGTPDEMTSNDPGILFPGDGSLEVQEHMTDDTASDVPISSSFADDLQGTPDEMTSNDPGILFPGDGSLEVQEHMTDDTASDVPISSSVADDLQGTSDEMTSNDPGILFPGDGSLEVQEHMTDDTASDVPISSSVADDLQGTSDEVTSSDNGILFPGDGTLGEAEYIEKDTRISSSAADDLQGVPDEGYHYSGDVLFPGNNTLGVEESIDDGSPSEDFSVAWDVSGVGNTENPSYYWAGEPVIETVRRDVLCSTPVEADATRVTAAPDSLSKLASSVVETGNREQGPVGGSETERNSSAYSLRRRLSDDFPSDETLTDGEDRELTRSSSETVVSPRSGDEMDGKEKLSSKSLSSLEYLSKGNKRMMAANFGHKYASEKDGGEDDDDDDSLYLSAREYSDSTGFMSATGSSVNFRDTDSDVTPSGYLSDPDEGFLVSETEDQTRLDRTLLAEKLEQYADK